MKDSENKEMTSAEYEEKFHVEFTAIQEDIERRILCSEAIPLQDMKTHFSKLNSSLQELQKLYSASSPYLRIYYRKVYQDALQDIQTKIAETETKILPRKKFVFKGKMAKGKLAPTKNGDLGIPKLTSKATDRTDGASECYIHDVIGQVIELPSGVATGKSVVLTRLRGCTVRVMAAPNTVHLTDVKDCTISIGPATTSVFVEGGSSCTFHIACQQLRIHETTASDFFIHVTSKAIIEECQNVRFGVYTFSYPNLEEDYRMSGLDRNVNNWRDIDDFNWLVAGQPSPNWTNIDVSS